MHGLEDSTFAYEKQPTTSLYYLQMNHNHGTGIESGTIMPEHRELTEPFQVSAKTFEMMDSTVKHLRIRIVSDAIDLSEFSDEHCHSFGNLPNEDCEMI